MSVDLEHVETFKVPEPKPRLTNVHGLPEPLVRAVTWSDRNREGCDYTITELLRPPRIAALERIHVNEITEDASDRLWALLGSAGHEVLRLSADKSRIVEERAIVEVTVNGKVYKVGGQLDYSESDHSIWDYKFCSVWVAKDGPREEWTQQLNCYRWLAAQYGVKIDKLQIVAIYRDWSKRKAGDKNYPKSQVEVFELEVWPLPVVEQFVQNAIEIQELAKEVLPECTPAETWEKKDWKTKTMTRPRCESYCMVAKFCTIWQDFQRANLKTKDS